MASPIPLTQEEERLKLYTNYFVQVEPISVKVRHLSNNKDLYNAAVAKWTNESPRIPPADDEKKRAEYFNQCNEICSKEPKDPEDCFRTIFAIYAAIQVITDQDLLKVPERSRGRILGAANRLSFAQIQKEKPKLPESHEPMKPRLPPHLVPVYFPEAKVDKHGSELFGSTIRYHNGKNGKIEECTICDFGTSYLKGDWFLVTYDDDAVVEITASDMDDILKNPPVQLADHLESENAISHTTDGIDRLLDADKHKVVSS